MSASKGTYPWRGLLGGGHGYVGGAEVDLPGAERGAARAAAHGGIADRHSRVLQLVCGEGHGEERRVERRPGSGKGRRVAAGATLAAATAEVLVVAVLLQAATARREVAAAAA
jgi:hypothetical protein